MSPENHKSKIDIKEFEAIFRELFVPLCRYAHTYLSDQDSSREVVHDVFVQVWERHEKLHLDIPLKSYLYTSVRNRSLNYLRDRSKFHNTKDSDYDEIVMGSTDEVDFLEVEELEQKIQLVLQDLPEKCAEIFRMNRFEGLRYKEIADQLKISVKTVEAQMSKALRILRENLREYLYLLIFWLIERII